MLEASKDGGSLVSSRAREEARKDTRLSQWKGDNGNELRVWQIITQLRAVLLR